MSGCNPGTSDEIRNEYASEQVYYIFRFHPANIRRENSQDQIPGSGGCVLSQHTFPSSESNNWFLVLKFCWNLVFHFPKLIFPIPGRLSVLNDFALPNTYVIYRARFSKEFRKYVIPQGNSGFHSSQSKGISPKNTPVAFSRLSDQTEPTWHNTVLGNLCFALNT